MASKLGPVFKGIGNSLGHAFGGSSPFNPTAALKGGFARPFSGLGSLKPAMQWGQDAKYFQNLGVAGQIPNAAMHESMKTLSPSAWSSYIPGAAFGATKSAAYDLEKRALAGGVGKELSALVKLRAGSTFAIPGMIPGLRRASRIAAMGDEFPLRWEHMGPPKGFDVGYYEKFLPDGRNPIIGKSFKPGMPPLFGRSFMFGPGRSQNYPMGVTMGPGYTKSGATKSATFLGKGLAGLAKFRGGAGMAGKEIMPAIGKGIRAVGQGETGVPPNFFQQGPRKPFWGGNPMSSAGRPNRFLGQFMVNHPSYTPGAGASPWSNFNSPSFTPPPIGTMPPGFSKMSAFQLGFSNEIAHMLWDREMEKQAFVKGLGRLIGGSGRIAAKVPGAIGGAVGTAGRAIGSGARALDQDISGTENAISGMGGGARKWLNNQGTNFSQSMHNAYHGIPEGVTSGDMQGPVHFPGFAHTGPIGSGFAPGTAAEAFAGTNAKVPSFAGRSDLATGSRAMIPYQRPPYVPPNTSGRRVFNMGDSANPGFEGHVNPNEAMDVYRGARSNPAGGSPPGFGDRMGGYYNQFKGAIGGMDPNKWYTKGIVGPGAAGMTPEMRGQVGAGRLGLVGGAAGLMGLNGGVNEYEAAKRRDAIRNQSRWGLAAGALFGGPEGVINSLHL